MITSPISSSPISLTEVKDLDSLKKSIMHLKALKINQEEALRNDITELINSVNPVLIVKNSLKDLASDKEVQFSLVKVGLNLGAELLTAKLFGKQNSLPLFLGMKLAKKIVSYFLKDKSAKPDQLVKLLSGSEIKYNEESEADYR